VSPNDDEVRAHFDDLRAEDRAVAPEFSALWSEAERRAHAPPTRSRMRSRMRVAWWLAAASAIIAATLLVQRARRRDTLSDAAIAGSMPYPNVTSWTSPTDGLLRMSRRTTLASPSLRQSVLDGVATPLPMQPNSPKRGGL
jgi:hypothetical protein